MTHRRSGRQNGHPDSVSSECLEILRVRCERGALRFGDGDNERSDRGSGSCQATELSGSPRERLGDLLDDVTGLEELIGRGVPSGVALQALHENNGRNQWRPDALAPEGADATRPSRSPRAR